MSLVEKLAKLNEPSFAGEIYVPARSEKGFVVSTEKPETLRQEAIPIKIDSSSVEQDRGASPKGAPNDVSMPVVEIEPSRYDAPPFWNVREPSFVLSEEKPHHRFVCYLKAQGFSNKEICDQTGWSAFFVCNTLKQPWATEMIAKLMAEAGCQGIEAVLKGAAMKAALEMEDLLERAKTEGSLEVERKVRKDMMDRWFGTAAQHVIHTNVDPSTLTDAELAKHLDNKTN